MVLKAQGLYIQVRVRDQPPAHLDALIAENSALRAENNVFRAESDTFRVEMVRLG